jgi:hypothetical protein
MARVIRLPGDEEERLVVNALTNLQNDRSDRGSKIDAIQAFVRLYEGFTERKDDPWPNASNFHMPLVRSHTLTIHPRLMQAVFGVSPACNVLPVGVEDMESARRVERFMDWSFVNEIGAYSKMDEFLLSAIQDGTAVCFQPWRRDVRRSSFSRTIEKYVEGTEGRQEKGDEEILREVLGIVDGGNVEVLQVRPRRWGYAVTLLVGGRPDEVQVRIERETENLLEIEVEMEREEVFYDAPDLVTVPIDDFYVPGNAPRDLQRAHHILYRRSLSMDGMMRGWKNGLFPLLTKDEVDEYRQEWSTRAGQEPQRGTWDERGVRDQEEQSTGVDSLRSQQWDFEVLDFYRRWDIDGDGYEEEIIAFVERRSEKLLGVHRLEQVFAAGRRPFGAFQLIPRRGSFWGIGVPELLAPVNVALNTRFNQKVDRDTITNIPFGFFEPRSGLKGEAIRVTPGKMIPVNSTQGILFPTFAQRDMTGIQDINMLMAFAEGLSPVNDMVQGRSPSRPNAPRTYGATVALLQEAGVRYQHMIDRLKNGVLRDIFEQNFALYGQHLPPTKEFRITGSQTITSIPKEDFRRRYDFVFTANSLNTNRLMARQEDVTLYTLMRSDPVVLQTPRLQLELTRMALRAFQRERLEEVLPSPEELEAAQPMSPEREELLILQGVKVLPTPNQDHAAHLEHHVNFLKTTPIPPECVANMVDLIKAHEAMAAMQASQPQPMIPSAPGFGEPRQQPMAPLPGGGAATPPMPGPPAGAPGPAGVSGQPAVGT